MKTLRSHFRIATVLFAAAGFAVGFLVLPLLSGGAPGARVGQPQAPFTDYRHEQPGAIHKVTSGGQHRRAVVSRFRLEPY
jgi:hypothetical protein